MAEHSLYGKKKLCYTEVTDFTDFQGIGADPLYKRYDSVFSVIKKHIPEEYQDFFAQPLYSDQDDQISWYCKDWIDVPDRFPELSPDKQAYYSAIKNKTLKVYNDVLAGLKGEDAAILRGALVHIGNDFMFCYDDKVSVVAWGMVPDTTQHKVIGSILHGFNFQKKRTIRFDEGAHGSFPTKIDGKMTRPDGYVLLERDMPPAIKVKEGYEFAGWDPEPLGYKISADTIFTAKYNKIEVPVINEPEKVAVHFRTNDCGMLSGESTVILDKGACLSASQIPSVLPSTGYHFTGWDTETCNPIENDTVINAVYQRDDIYCKFEAGEFGTITGPNLFTIPYGNFFPSSSVPLVTPKKGYRFTGWSTSPSSTPIEKDTTFVAQYEKEKKIPWYKRFWMFLTGKGCLKWFLWLLLALLLLFLSSLLFRSCAGIGFGAGFGPGISLPGNMTAPGIVGEDGRLPGGGAVAPIAGENGSLPPIQENPGSPDIVANRLNIYFEDENVDFNQFASDFKQIYQGDQYQIIGFDPEVKFIQIQIPEDERDTIRENLNSQLPGYNFFIVDESIFSLHGFRTSANTDDAGWHLKAINLKEAWEITKGDSNVTIAVVDDGCDVNHEILKDRIVSPYNVFTQSQEISAGVGHGTHVAGIAAGSDKHFTDGVSGIAPRCKLMPVQVFENESCTFSSLTSGIMYAIHHGADVINVSVGPSFEGLNILPVEDQAYISETQFKNEEKVWRRIISIANSKNAILVFAAGNDDILTSISPECRTNGTLNVTAVDKSLTVTQFSNYGKGSNISAPGKDIKSSFPQNQYKVCDGTSMAAPIVTGTVALLKSQNKNINVSEVLSILQQSGKAVNGNIPSMVQADRALIMQRDGSIAPTPDNVDNNSNNTPAPAQQQTNYDEIRKMIEQYKEKIKELEQQLPENNR